MTNKADRLEKLMAEMLEIYKAKNKDYGDSFSKSFEEFGLIAPVVRMNDKMNRIKNLAQSKGRQVKGDSLRDSLMDLANYAIMTVVELDQQVEDWKKENFGTIGRPDAFEAAVRDCEKKFYLKHRYLQSSLTNSNNILCYSVSDDKLALCNGINFPKYKTYLTLEEIEEIKEKFDTDLADFELEEVDDD